MLARRVTPIIIALLLVGGMALADNKEVARDAYRDGTRLYDLADFTHALEAFKKAYFNYEDPAFLFNIAQCYRQLGNRAEAIRFYKTYLRKVPDAANGEEVRRLIHSLEEPPSAAPPTVTAPPSAAAPPRPAATATEAPPLSAAPPPSATAAAPGALDLTARKQPVRRPTPAYKRWWVWTLVGVAAAGAATGLALGLTHASHEATLPAVHVP